jgi:hypothetical protein
MIWMELALSQLANFLRAAALAALATDQRRQNPLSTGNSVPVVKPESSVEKR